MANPDENALMWKDTPFAEAFLPEVRDAFALLADQYDEATSFMPAGIADGEFLEVWQSLYDYAIEGQRQLRESARMEETSPTGKRTRSQKSKEGYRLAKESGIDLSPEGLRKQVNASLASIRERQAYFIYNKVLGVSQIGRPTDYQVGQEVIQDSELRQTLQER